MLTVSAERTREEQSEGEGRPLRAPLRHVHADDRPAAGHRRRDIQASYANGVLELHVRKPEQRKPRRIQVGTAQQTIEGAATKQ